MNIYFYILCDMVCRKTTYTTMPLTLARSSVGHLLKIAFSQSSFCQQLSVPMLPYTCTLSSAEHPCVLNGERGVKPVPDSSASSLSPREQKGWMVEIQLPDPSLLRHQPLADSREASMHIRWSAGLAQIFLMCMASFRLL